MRVWWREDIISVKEHRSLRRHYEEGSGAGKGCRTVWCVYAW